MLDVRSQILDEIKINANEEKVVFDKFVGQAKNINHTTKITLESNSKLIYFLGIFDCFSVNKTIEVNLRGKASEAKILGVYLGKGSNNYHFRVVSNHEGSNTRALTWINGILTDKSESNFDGLVKIVPDVSGVNSYLANHVLVLGEEAKANAIPSLEIESHDVKCSHEATVGQIDETHMFYLMSRGISREDAQDLIVRGFFESVVVKIDNTEFRSKILTELKTQLGG